MNSLKELQKNIGNKFNPVKLDISDGVAVKKMVFRNFFRIKISRYFGQ
jgi:NADP-dependent 3-hydroxy acid dehydrogenase YdfG